MMAGYNARSGIRRRILSVLALALLLISLPMAAQADIGPKPTMDFQFEFPEGSGLSIVGGELLQCQDAGCSASEPLPELGPQRFECEAAGCSAMAYSFADYQRLRIEFSDGRVLASNVFEKIDYNAAYRVTLVGDALLVEPLEGGMREPPLPLPLALPAGFLGCGGLLLVLVLASLLSWQRAKSPASPASKWLCVVLWLVMLPLAGLGTLLSTAVPLTMLIEGIIAWIYALLRKHPRGATLTAVLAANLFTLLPFWFALRTNILAPTLGVIAAIEGAIWLVEAALIWLALRKSMKLVEALLFALLINVVSFAVGLLLYF